MPRCDLGRGNDQGVVGHDGAASTRLPDGSVLFVFGDTLLGTIRGDRRRVTGLISSSGALLPAAADVCSGRLRYLTDARGAVRPLLPSAGRGTASWPVDVTVLDGRVWMLYRLVAATGTVDEAGFRILGTGLAVADPDRLAFRPAARLLVTGDDVVPAALFGDQAMGRLRTVVCGDGSGPCRAGVVDRGALRLRATRPGSPAAWLTDPVHLTRWGATAVSWAKLPRRLGALWRLAATPGLGCRLRVATGPAPDQPLRSAPPIALPRRPGAACYAGRVQEALSRPGRTVVTWVDSRTGPTGTRTDARLYWPHVAELRSPP
ncbi:MAG: hypothetical protein HYX34_02185 [Actinobacteria bacterium]|nr:hypothetical protein [Actinomycetota bacterium]